MQESNKVLQYLGIPHSALLSVIFGMMLLSFPMGMFVVFNTNVGDNITFEYPVAELEFFDELGFSVPFNVSIGDVFTVLWSIYAILFTIAIFGPKNGFLQTLSHILSHGKVISQSNYLVSITKWFSVLILISAIITFTQEEFGIQTVPPSVDNNLIQFFYVTLAPLVEEIGFRSFLMGIPIFVIYSHKYSIKHFFKSIWSPSRNLHIYDSKKVLFLIVAVGVLFGFAHIATGDPWSEGKFAQASASGIILGWLYLRFGLLSSIVVHWGTNYFVFSYVNFISQVNEISLDSAFNHSLISTMEILFLISGVFSVGVLLLTFLYSKKESKLEI